MVCLQLLKCAVFRPVFDRCDSKLNITGFGPVVDIFRDAGSWQFKINYAHLPERIQIPSLPEREQPTYTKAWLAATTTDPVVGGKVTE